MLDRIETPMQGPVLGSIGRRRYRCRSTEKFSMGSASTTSDLRTPAAGERVAMDAAVPNRAPAGPWRDYYDPDSAAYDEVSFAESFTDRDLADQLDAERALEAGLAV
jgi:hypothetical protein